MNPALLRLSLDLWWHDESARALGELDRGVTSHVGAATGVRDLAPGIAETGDLAVTLGGVHVLACLGGSQWIEADPNEGRVVIVSSQDSNSWLRQRITLVRWSALR